MSHLSVIGRNASPDAEFVCSDEIGQIVLHLTLLSFTHTGVTTRFVRNRTLSSPGQERGGNIA